MSDAARAFGVPVAFLGLLEAKGEVLEAVQGWNVALLPPAASFAEHLRGTQEVLVVPDALEHPGLSEHPLVAGAPHVRFFAAAPLHAPDGTFLGALSVTDEKPRIPLSGQLAVLEILAREAMRELACRVEVSESAERFRELFEQTDDLVMSLAPDGTLLHLNETAHQSLGITRGMQLSRLVDPEGRDAFRRTFAEVFESGEPRRVETVFISEDGRRITLEGSLWPKLIEGRAVLARVVFRDVSDRKEFEAELGNARDAALEAARLKTQFLTNVSHEIRTPMNGIVGMIDLLLSSRLETEQLDFAHQARASAEQLLSIVNNILYVSNLEAGGLAASSVDFDLQRMLQRVVEVMKIAALGKDVEVSLVYDSMVPPIVRGNQSKLRQVITNLMENAVKFTEEGRIVLSVGLQTETDTHRVVRFDVSDTGIGFDEEDRLLLFERFSQVEATSTRRYGGVGLGLATAKQLVETMGGLIDAEGNPGKGSTFGFAIPFPKHTAGRRPIASSDLELRGKRVLLIDHVHASRRIVRHYLETTWEMRVDTASDADEALAMLQSAAKRDPFRVVVFDKTTDLEPFAFAQAVRHDPALQDTALVYLFASGSKPNEEEMRAAGIQSVARKPVGQGELFDALTVALAHDAISLPRSAAQTTGVSNTRPVPRIVPPEERALVRVLLAEDNFLNMKLTMSQLEKLGYAAQSVANGQEAIDAVLRDEVDVIVMDCQMPIIDGYEATAEIRRREKSLGRRHHIIAMTANALEGDREKCLAAGMDDYLAKPTRTEELEAALSRVDFSSRV